MFSWLQMAHSCIRGDCGHKSTSGFYISSISQLVLIWFTKCNYEVIIYCKSCILFVYFWYEKFKNCLLQFVCFRLGIGKADKIRRVNSFVFNLSSEHFIWYLCDSSCIMEFALLYFLSCVKLRHWQSDSVRLCREQRQIYHFISVLML